MNKLIRCFLMFAVGVLPTATLCAQVTGGQHAFSYLDVDNLPHAAALGGIVPAGDRTDVGFVTENPALLNPKMHNQLALSYNLYYAGIGIGYLQYAYHIDTIKTDIGFGVQYFNYGKFQGTDVYGNKIGEVNAADYALNFSVSRRYLKHWRYGATLKLAHSMLAGRQALALLADVGVLYVDTSHLWSFGIVAKNMGVTLKKYNKQMPAEPLPFDLQIGISKKLRHVPLRLYLNGHHLYEWNIRYNNPAEVKDNTLFGNQDTTTKEKSYFVDKLFRHISIGAELLIGKRIIVSAGYNHLHRAELGVGQTQGLAGFSFGLGINLNKFHIQYTRSYLSTAGAFNQFGLRIQLNEIFGIGAPQSGWNRTY